MKKLQKSLEYGLVFNNFVTFNMRSDSYDWIDWSLINDDDLHHRYIDQQKAIFFWSICVSL